MLDLKLLRQDVDAVTANLARRGFVFNRPLFVELEARRNQNHVNVEYGREQL